MTFFDIRVQIFPLAAANGFDEILPIASTFPARGPWLLFAPEECLVRIVSFNGHVAFGAIEDIADAVAIRDHSLLVTALANGRFVIRHPVTDFENDQRLLAVLVEFEGG